MLSPALAGTRRASELAKRVISACIREICFFRDFMGLQKTKIFLVTFGSASLYNFRQLACESQTGSLAYFSVDVRKGTKKTTSSLDRSSASSNMQVAAFAAPLCKDKQW